MVCIDLDIYFVPSIFARIIISNTVGREILYTIEILEFDNVGCIIGTASRSLGSIHKKNLYTIEMKTTK